MSSNLIDIRKKYIRNQSYSILKYFLLSKVALSLFVKNVYTHPSSVWYKREVISVHPSQLIVSVSVENFSKKVSRSMKCHSITSQNTMLKFLILSLFVCWVSSAPQYENTPNELDRSSWTLDRISRRQEIEKNFAGPERNVRIVGGSSAQPNQFRHVAALFLKLFNQESFCGGSIIHVNFILTAAHCLDDLISIDVIAGTTNIFRGTPPYRATVMSSDIRQHSGYDKVTLRDDIGLVCLRTAIQTSSQIAPVRLPARSMVQTNLVQRPDRPFLIGWGRTSDGKFETNN
jgi:hypothetical protein